MTRPDLKEYAPYYEKYISLVPGDNIVTTLNSQIEGTLTLLRGLSESQGELRYAPGKWSIKEVIGHLIDGERIFTYRALRMARGDQTPLPGFDENSYVDNGNFGDRRLAELADEFQAVRKSSAYIFRHLGEDAWGRRGVASDNEVSVRAIAHIIAGHELHHIGIIRTRYLGMS
jgi:DinB superfamily